MADHRLPVSGTTSDGKPVAIKEIGTGYLTQVAGWSNFVTAAADWLHGFAMLLPADYRTTARQDRSTVWRVSPDRILLRTESPVEAMQSADIVTLDLTQARVCVSLTGPGAAGLLSRVMGLDFSESAFPVGTFMQGSLHHVGVLVDRRGSNEFELLIPTTWADSLVGLLADHLRAAAA